jgi:hypothetical protein
MTIAVAGAVGWTEGGLLGGWDVGTFPFGRPFTLAGKSSGIAGTGIRDVEYRGAVNGTEGVRVGSRWYEWNFGTGTGVST